MVEYQVGDTVFEILNNSSDKFSRAQEQTNQDSRVWRILPLKIHYLREDDMSRQKGPEAGIFVHLSQNCCLRKRFELVLTTF